MLLHGSHPRAPALLPNLQAACLSGDSCAGTDLLTAANWLLAGRPRPLLPTPLPLLQVLHLLLLPERQGWRWACLPCRVAALQLAARPHPESLR